MNAIRIRITFSSSVARHVLMSVWAKWYNDDGIAFVTVFAFIFPPYPFPRKKKNQTSDGTHTKPECKCDFFGYTFHGFFFHSQLLWFCWLLFLGKYFKIQVNCSTASGGKKRVSLWCNLIQISNACQYFMQFFCQLNMLSTEYTQCSKKARI